MRWNRGRWDDVIEVDYWGTRALVLEAIRQERGNLCRTARRLQTNYPVVNRLVRRLGLWGEVDRVRRAAERHAMLIPEPAQPRLVQPHRLKDNSRDQAKTANGWRRRAW
jgi:hypothetical protein